MCHLHDENTTVIQQLTQMKQTARFSQFQNIHIIISVKYFRSYSPVYVRRCRNIYYIFGHVPMLMFVSVNFWVMFTASGHIHSVILYQPSDYSSYIARKKVKRCNKTATWKNLQGFSNVIALSFVFMEQIL